MLNIPIELLKSGKPSRAIAKEIGCHHSSVIYARRRLGLPIKYRVEEEQLSKVDELSTLALPLRTIAGDVGVSHSTVARRLREKRKNLTKHNRCPECGVKLFTTECIACRATKGGR